METEIQSLKDFSGTEQYYTGYLGVNLTDGSYFVGCNSASWLITDICSVLKVDPKVKGEDFVSIKFKVNLDNTAEVIYTDGNYKVLFKQKYEFTDFKEHFKESEVSFFYTGNVLMLASEY
ncbi:MAG: hypothetical protein NT076_02165 [Candidatus Pacearchaeota archaeon]|nr:hypothetical protein [Candidatus Pacearchaeota archaeon]